MAAATKPKTQPLDEPAPSRKPSKIRWLLGWVLGPSLMLGGLFFGGVHVGARHPDMWLSRASLWVFDKQPQRGPATAAERKGMAERMRLAVLPKQDVSMRLSLTAAELGALASELHTKVDDLKCEDVCRLQWQAEHKEREFFGAARCELTPAKDDKPAKVECDASVQRELEEDGSWLPKKP